MSSVHNAIAFEMDLNHYEIIRTEFTFLDWLSAVGGLGSITFAIVKRLGSLADA